MWVELEQFLAADTDGVQYTVCAFQRQVIYRTRKGNQCTRKGRVSYRLMDGRSVELLTEERELAFRVTDNGQIIRRIAMGPSDQAE